MLNKSHFYYQLTKKYIVAFASIFSDIHVLRRDSNAKIIQDITVPITFAEKDKLFYDLNKRDDDVGASTILPRMGFNLSDMNFASERKTNSLNESKITPPYWEITIASKNYEGTLLPGEFVASNNASPGIGYVRTVTDSGADTVITIFIQEGTFAVNDKIDIQTKTYAVDDGTISAVEDQSDIMAGYLKEGHPWDFVFDLYILCKNGDDLMQIIEQIAAFFHPTFSLNVIEIPEFGIIRDVNINLNDFSMAKETDMGEEDHRIMSAEGNFTLHGMIYPPIDDQGFIQLVNTNFYDKDTLKLMANIEHDYDALTKITTTTITEY
jgi:hypothetical protein